MLMLNIIVSVVAGDENNNVSDLEEELVSILSVSIGDLGNRKYIFRMISFEIANWWTGQKNYF